MPPHTKLITKVRTRSLVNYIVLQLCLPNRNFQDTVFLFFFVFLLFFLFIYLFIYLLIKLSFKRGILPHSRLLLSIWRLMYHCCVLQRPGLVSIMNHLVGKPTICIGENKDADQLRGNREADQRLCFRYSDSTIPLLLKSEISSF